MQTTSSTLKTLLTQREIEVCQLVACGRSNQRIADELGIADGTVKVHLKRVFRKAGLRNRTHLASVMLIA